MPTKKTTTTKKPAVKAASVKAGITVGVVGADGKELEAMQLPKEIFAVPYNKKLIALAVRVYLANQREGSASTKTRGEVEGSTRKIYRQKGTGRARHGGIRAPIFVGGGIAFGPRPRDYRMAFPKEMRRAAFISALSFSRASGCIKVLDGVETMELKTKPFASLFSRIGYTKRVLYVVGKDSQKTVRAVRNIAGVTARGWKNLSVYDLATHTRVLFAKDAMMELIAQKG